MNRELFDNAKALVESRKIEAVEVALQTVYGQGTDAQKAEIERLAIGLMMLNSQSENIQWSIGRFENAQWNDKVFLLHFIAEHIVRSSSESLKCEPSLLKSLFGMWESLFEAIEMHPTLFRLRKVLTHAKEMRRINASYSFVLEQMDEDPECFFIYLNTIFGVCETGVAAVLRYDCAHIRNSVYHEVCSRQQLIDEYAVSKDGYCFKFMWDTGFSVDVELLDGTALSYDFTGLPL